MMPGIQFEDIWKALTGCFSKNSLKQMLRARLNRRLDDIVADGSLKDMTFELLETAEKEGWADNLAREAFRYNPGCPELVTVSGRYGFAVGVSLQLGGTPDAAAPTSVADAGFERRVKDNLPLLDMTLWRERMALIERRVCRIETQGRATGTGFLVGPDVVLTNYHVMASVLDGGVPATAITCRFDYKALADGTRSEGLAVALHATNWRVAESPPSEAERKGAPDSQLPTPLELDFALVCLQRDLGNAAVVPNPGQDAPKRGWVTVPPTQPDLAPKMPLLIAQHPDGSPLKLALDTEAVIGENANGTRVRYATNTEPGSSGSPCFNIDWTLVALHHYGDPAYGHPRFNQGIPIGRIRDRLRETGKAGVLGAESP